MGKFKHRKPDETDLEFYELEGPVKQLMQVCYKAHRKAGEVVKGFVEVGSGLHNCKNFVVSFNENGRKTKLHNLAKDSYDISHYNNKGNVFEKIESYLKGHIEQTKNYFDDQDRTVLYERYDGNGKLSFKSVWVYNTDGKELENCFYQIINGEEKVFQKTIYEYDERGNMTANIQYNAENAINHQFHNKFNEDNKIIESRTEYFGERMRKHSFITRNKYNTHGDCIHFSKYTIDEALLFEHHYDYKYDADGTRIIEQPKINLNDDEEETNSQEEIETDDRGNWVVKTTFHNNIPVNFFERKIVYFDDENVAELKHPLEDEDVTVAVRNDEEDDEDLAMEAADVKWLVEANNNIPKNFPAQRYYVVKFKKIPSIVHYNAAYIDVMGLYHQLIDNMHASEIHSYANISTYRDDKENYTLEFNNNKGYLLQVDSIYTQDEAEFIIPDFIDEQRYDNRVFFGNVQLFRPAQNSNSYDRFFEEELYEYISLCTLTKKPDKPVINIIEVKGNNFATKERAVDDNFEIRDLDVNYGYGFEKFHNELMERFHTSTKGLVLFHGLPGTGKTYYIRHLLRKMASNNKVVIYMPPNMVDHLVDPGFMTFLADEIKDWSSEGKFCVLLIEDAEPLLAKRQEGVRIQGVTNLLNMTDGLLNDMLNLQIICTFNVDLRKLDSALLRPGRLIARKEFKALSELDANLLAQRLGIKHHFKKPATLSEIYAMRKNQNTLIHDVDSDHNASTMIDDLI